MVHWRKALPLGLLCLAVPGAVYGQEDLRGVGVLDRLRPAYDPDGVRLGAFEIKTGVKVSETYTDNVFASETNKKSDIITSVAPDITVTSTWSRHQLRLRGSLDTRFHAQESDENATDWALGADGRIDITRNTTLALDAGYRREHEERGEPDAFAAAEEPTQYDIIETGFELAQRFNRFSVALGGRYADVDYEDVARIGGGTIDNDFRDREEYLAQFKLGYEVSPDTSLFALAEVNQHDYDRIDPALGAKRDSEGYELRGGVDLKLTRLVDGQVYVGYREQQYDAAALEDVSGVSYGANLNWYATPLTTLRFTALSDLEETIEAGASGNERTAFGAAVDHELLRNLILTADASYENEDFIGSSREDDTYTLGFGGTYLMNRHFRFGLNYKFTSRDSTDLGEDYDENLIGVFIRTDL